MKRFYGVFFLVMSLMACSGDSSLPADVTSAPDVAVDTDPGASDTEISVNDTAQTPEDTVDPTEAAFDPNHVIEVEVTIAPKDWEALTKEARTFADILTGECLAQPFPSIFNWYPASVKIDGEDLGEIEIRKKGFFGSLSETKPSLKLKLQAVQEELTWRGMKRLTLNNSRQDPSLLNTCLSYKVFRDAGYPAPRCSYARVTVNGSYLGVYLHVDSMKKPFLARHFGDDDGNLYEGQLSDFNETFRGTIQKKTNEKENDWTDVETAVKALATDGLEGMAAIDKIFNIDRFLTFWAIETLVGHWDGYNGNLNNYYFYTDPADGRIVFLPWGPDSAFYPVDHPFDEFEYPPSVLANSSLARRLYADSAIRTAYQDRMRWVLDTVWNEEALTAETERVQVLLDPHLSGENKAKFLADIDRIKWFIGMRKEQVLADLAASPDWTIPERTSPCWKPRGEIDIEFSTTWDTLNVQEPWKQGEVIFHAFNFMGEPIQPPPSGSTSGIETKGGGAGNLAVTTFTMTENGDLYFFYLSMSPLLPAVGKKLLVGEDLAGYWFLLKPPYNGNLEMIGQLGDGELVFDAFSMEPGEPVSGRYQALIF